MPGCVAQNEKIIFARQGVSCSVNDKHGTCLQCEVQSRTGTQCKSIVFSLHIWGADNRVVMLQITVDIL